jgi:hypothetical protein
LDKSNFLSTTYNDFLLLSKPLAFSHKRYFLIRIRQIIFRYRTNSPFLSCDSFANEADYIAFGITGLKRINKKRLKKAKILFVKTHQLEYLINNFGKLISAKVILTGNSDLNLIHPLALPQSVQVVFAQNCSIIGDAKYKVLPIGIENLRGGRSGLKKFHSPVSNHEILYKVYLPPMAPTNPIRFEILNSALVNHKYFEVDRIYKNEQSYFSSVKKYKFVFCCEGNGFETHRIWETLYQGSFPVMLESKWSRSLSTLNLPILIVKSISDINDSILQDFLSKNMLFNPVFEEKLWIYYWRNLFNSYL